MKATISGITVEGTPQEIMEFQRLQMELNSATVKKDISWIKMGTPNISGQTLMQNPDIYYKYNSSANIEGKCPNGEKACFCTGQCK